MIPPMIPTRREAAAITNHTNRINRRVPGELQALPNQENTLFRRISSIFGGLREMFCRGEASDVLPPVVIEEPPEIIWANIPNRHLQRTRTRTLSSDDSIDFE